MNLIGTPLDPNDVLYLWGNIPLVLSSVTSPELTAAQARITELETSLENLLSVHPLHPHAHQDTQDAHEKASNALRKETA